MRLLVGVKIEGLNFGAVIQLLSGFDASGGQESQTQMLNPLLDKSFKAQVKIWVLTPGG